MRPGVSVVLRILFCALGVGVVLGNGSAVVLDCIWDFGVGFGRCFVSCWCGRLVLLGRLKIGFKAREGRM